MDRRVALVTGSSRGLGAVMASRLATDGFAVAVNSFGAGEAGRDVVRAIRARGGVADVFTADVTDADGVAGLVAAVERGLGPIEVLVLNATGPQPDAPLERVGWEEHLAQLDFFVKSPVLLLRAVLPRMRELGYGRIVHVDSEVFDNPPPGRSAYVTAKGAQIGLARAWARELAPDGITVNCVSPGFIPVECHQDVPPDERGAYLATVPAGHIGTPADVAHAVAFFRLRGSRLYHRPAARRGRRARPPTVGEARRASARRRPEPRSSMSASRLAFWHGATTLASTSRRRRRPGTSG